MSIGITSGYTGGYTGGYGNYASNYAANTQQTNQAANDQPTKTEKETEKEPVKEIQNEPQKEKSETFSKKNDLMNYLCEKFPSVRGGAVSISGAYLRKCMSDPEEMKKLEQLLSDAEDMIADSKENVKGYQGSRVTIDENGEMKVETYSRCVCVNEGKRMRQIAAAKTPDNIQMVMGLLATDLADCEAGLADGSCDENEVAKVKALIQKAQQKMSELMGGGKKEDEGGFDSFTINLLM